MDITVCHLPVELLQSIFRSLNRHDIRATRQVCKTFNAIASPFLIRAAWISTQPRDWRVLEAISVHEIFSKSVQEIIYDVSFYDPYYSQTEYLSALKDDYLQNQRDNSVFKYSRALRGYRIYQERVDLQHQTLSQHVEYNATQSAKEYLRRHGVKETCVLPNQPDLENDLTHLIRALRLMPAVRTLTISYRRYQSQCLRYQLRYSGSPRCDHKECRGEQRKFSMEHMNDENVMAAVLHPLSFILSGRNVESSALMWNRALAVLDLANLASKKVSTSILQFPYSSSLRPKLPLRADLSNNSCRPINRCKA